MQLAAKVQRVVDQIDLQFIQHPPPLFSKCINLHPHCIMWLCRLLDNSHTYDAHSPHTFANQNGVCTFPYKIGKGEGGGTVALCLGWLAQHSNLPFLKIKSLVANKMKRMRKRERECARVQQPFHSISLLSQKLFSSIYQFSLSFSLSPPLLQILFVQNVGFLAYVCVRVKHANVYFCTNTCSCRSILPPLPQAVVCQIPPFKFIPCFSKPDFPLPNLSCLFSSPCRN